jgi:hypothetical protein
LRSRPALLKPLGYAFSNGLRHGALAISHGAPYRIESVHHLLLGSTDDPGQLMYDNSPYLRHV